MFQCWHLCIIFIQTVQHNVLVTHYGIRRLHSNTLRVSFPSHDIPLGRVLLWQSCLSEPSLRGADETEGEREGARLRSSHAESDSHYQLWLFLFLFTTTVNHPVTGSQGRREGKGEREREKKRQFSSKRIIYQNK